jgi:hypothetical protein
MFGRCRFNYRMMLVAVAGGILAVAGTARAEGLFDFLFRPMEPARSYAPTNAPSNAPPGFGTPDGSAPGGPRISGGTGRYSSYCVRLCDGRYFPIQRAGGARPGEICSSLCPASKTRIFSGSEIAYAMANDGSRYDSLENAFVYREKTVEGCTCNGTDAYGLAPMDIKDDPTLRKGDMIATANGIEKYAGAPKSRYTANESASAPAIRGSVDAEDAPPVRRRHRHRNVFSFFGLR